jgi:hypothetical protein
MKYFLELIETLKNNKTFLVEKTQERFNKYSPLYLNNLIKSCQPFVFYNSGETKDVNIESEIKIEFDAPFTVFSIEMLDGFISIPDSNKIDLIRIFIKCIMVFEIEPKKYDYCALVMSEQTTGIFENMILVTSRLDEIVKFFIDRINNEKIGTEQTKHKFKVGIGKEKYFHSIRKIIYVKPKLIKEDLENSSRTKQSEIVHKKIDWKQRWFSRGHWRKINGLGKDRAGTYCITNNTWVRESEKGPKDKELIKKVRVIKE